MKYTKYAEGDINRCYLLASFECVGVLPSEYPKKHYETFIKLLKLSDKIDLETT